MHNSGNSAIHNFPCAFIEIRSKTNTKVRLYSQPEVSGSFIKANFLSSSPGLLPGYGIGTPYLRPGYSVRTRSIPGFPIRKIGRRLGGASQEG